MSIARRIESWFEDVRGQPIVGRARAADMEMFGFGDTFRETDQRGRDVERAALALHIQCPWRLRDQQGAVRVGSWDADDDGFSVRDQRLADLMGSWADSPPRVAHATSDEAGGLTLVFDNGYRLEVFPNSSLPDEEQWRLLKAREDRHFVVRSDGVSDDG